MIVCGGCRLDHESRGEGVKLVVVPVDVSHRLSGLDSRSNRLISEALGVRGEERRRKGGRKILCPSVWNIEVACVIHVL